MSDSTSSSASDVNEDGEIFGPKKVSLQADCVNAILGFWEVDLRSEQDLSYNFPVEDQAELVPRLLVACLWLKQQGFQIVAWRIEDDSQEFVWLPHPTPEPNLRDMPWRGGDMSGKPHVWLTSFVDLLAARDLFSAPIRTLRLKPRSMAECMETLTSHYSVGDYRIVTERIAVSSPGHVGIQLIDRSAQREFDFSEWWWSYPALASYARKKVEWDEEVNVKEEEVKEEAEEEDEPDVITHEEPQNKKARKDHFPGATIFLEEDANRDVIEASVDAHLVPDVTAKLSIASPSQLPLCRSPRFAATDGASSWQSHATRETSTSGISVRSAAGSHSKCFLTNTLFRCPDDSFAHVEDIQQHEMLLGADGLLVEVIKVIHHALEERLVTTLRTTSSILEVTSDHRIAIPRGRKWQTIPARNLVVGDLVHGESGDPQMIESIEHKRANVEVYEIVFNPDVPIETFYDKSAAILTNGSKLKNVTTRRSRMNRGAFRRAHGIDGFSIPPTDTSFL